MSAVGQWRSTTAAPSEVRLLLRQWVISAPPQGSLRCCVGLTRLSLEVRVVRQIHQREAVSLQSPLSQMRQLLVRMPTPLSGSPCQHSGLSALVRVFRLRHPAPLPVWVVRKSLLLTRRLGRAQAFVRRFGRPVLLTSRLARQGRARTVLPSAAGALAVQSRAD